MNRNFRVVAQVAAAVSVAGVVVAAAALPASAAAPNEAYAAAATGLISLSQQALATYPGTSPVQLADIDVAGLVSTGLLTDTAGPTSASSTIANPSVDLGVENLTATAITSSCSLDTNTGTVSGNATLANAKTTGLLPITLAANPGPNTSVSIPGIASLTLNKQVTAPDGTLTVTALEVTLLGSTQTLDLGVSVCNAASLAPVPVIPGAALPAVAGGLGLLAIGGLGYQLTRRRSPGESA